MKIIHKLKAWSIRRALIRQRAENIKTIRGCRRAAKRLRIELAREIRLSGANREIGQASHKVICFERVPTTGALRETLSRIPKLEQIK